MISQNSSLTCHLLADCLNKMMYYVRSVTDCADNVIIYVHIMSLLHYTLEHGLNKVINNTINNIKVNIHAILRLMIRDTRAYLYN